MKKILIAFAFSLLSVTAFAEATFQQVETFIEQQQYEVASLALKEIIANHPNSAKAYYAMSQAQAGLGNLEKAQFALNKAKSIDPELKFATSSNIASLEQAITPQTKKIEVVTESHFWRNLFIALVVAGLFYGLYRFITRKRDDEPDTKFTGVDYGDPKPSGPKGPTGPTNPLTSPPSPAPAPSYGYASTPTPTVVNNHYGSNNDGLLTGVLLERCWQIIVIITILLLLNNQFMLHQLMLRLRRAVVQVGMILLLQVVAVVGMMIVLAGKVLAGTVILVRVAQVGIAQAVVPIAGLVQIVQAIVIGNYVSS